MSEVVAKRGALKAFREFLNTHCRNDRKHYHDGSGRHIYQQRTREYGDYLYAQDREMFDQEFRAAMRGEFPGFDSKPWRVHRENT